MLWKQRWNGINEPETILYYSIIQNRQESNDTGPVSKKNESILILNKVIFLADNNGADERNVVLEGYDHDIGGAIWGWWGVLSVPGSPTIHPWYYQTHTLHLESFVMFRIRTLNSWLCCDVALVVQPGHVGWVGRNFKNSLSKDGQYIWIWIGLLEPQNHRLCFRGCLQKVRNFYLELFVNICYGSDLRIFADWDNLEKNVRHDLSDLSQ